MFVSFDIVTMVNIFKTLLTEHGDFVFHVPWAGTTIQHPLDGIAGWLVAYDNTRPALLYYCNLHVGSNPVFGVDKLNNKIRSHLLALVVKFEEHG